MNAGVFRNFLCRRTLCSQPAIPTSIPCSLISPSKPRHPKSRVLNSLPFSARAFEVYRSPNTYTNSQHILTPLGRASREQNQSVPFSATSAVEDQSNALLIDAPTRPHTTRAYAKARCLMASEGWVGVKDNNDDATGRQLQAQIKGKADAYSMHIPTLQRPTTLHYTSPHPLLASSLTHISLPSTRLTSNPGLISRFLSFALSATQTSTIQRSL
ncbi:hypothetical protein ACTXT7_012288 [Hymenolepis weldensis]